jgi:hypothetical protein
MIYGVAKIITAGLYGKDIQKIRGRSINKRIIRVLAFGTLLAVSGNFFLQNSYCTANH